MITDKQLQTIVIDELQLNHVDSYTNKMVAEEAANRIKDMQWMLEEIIVKPDPLYFMSSMLNSQMAF